VDAFVEAGLWRIVGREAKKKAPALADRRILSDGGEANRHAP
jgi:hypothetical protein